MESIFKKFVAGKEPNFDCYECKGVMHLNENGDFVYGEDEDGEESYYNVWLWSKQNPLAFNSQCPYVANIVVDAKCGKYKDELEPRTGFPPAHQFQFNRADASCIKKCFDSLYPIGRNGKMFPSYPGEELL